MKIPDHELVCRIGQGSYGEVWLARHFMGSYRAAKFVFRKTFRDKQPYIRELAGIQRFEPVSRSHPGFVHVLHVGRDDAEEYFYYLMELADSTEPSGVIHPDHYQPKTLSTEIARHGQLPVGECLKLALRLSSALAHLHDKGLVHRDIKPSNIVFVDGEAKLADIGLVTGLNEALSYVGTEGFIPPEGPGAPQADIYSLGKALYEAATGRDRQQFPELPAGLFSSPDASRFLELNEIIVKACDPNRERRYATAAEMLGELQFIESGRSLRRTRRQAALLKTGLKATAVLAVFGGVAYGVIADQKEKRHAQIEAQKAELRSANTAGVIALGEGRHLQALSHFIKALEIDNDATSSNITEESRGHDSARANSEGHRMRIHTALLSAPKLTQMWFESRPVQHAEFSRDGSLALIVSDKVSLKKTDSGASIGERFGPPGLTDASFSPQGFKVLTTSTNGAAIWDAHHQITVSFAVGVSLRSGRFNHNGSQIVTAGEDGIVRVWTSEGELLHELRGHSGGVIFADFSHDGAWIVTCGKDGRALIWNTRTGEQTGLAMQHGAAVYYASFSPDNHRIVTACIDHKARLWRCPSGEDTAGLMQLNAAPRIAEFSPDGMTILAAGERTVSFFSANGANTGLTPLLNSGSITSAAFDRTGRRVITASSDGSVRIWDLAGGTELPDLLVAHGKTPASKYDLLQADRGQFPAAAFLTNALRVRLLEDGKTLRAGPLNGPAKTAWEIKLATETSVDNLYFSEDGDRVANVLNKVVQIHGVSNRLEAEWTFPETVQTLAFDSQTARVAVATSQQVFIRAIDGDSIIKIIVPAPVLELDFSADGKRLITCLQAQVGDPAGAPNPIAPLSSHLPTTNSPANLEEHIVISWNAATGERTSPPTAHDHHVSGGYSIGNRAFLLTVNSESALRAWDVRSGGPASQIVSNKRRYSSVTLLPDGKSALTVEAGGSRIWLWRFGMDQHSLKDLRTLRGLLCDEWEDVQRGTARIEKAWKDFPAREPDLFHPSSADIFSWHVRQARAAAYETNWDGAILHLETLLSLNPQSQLVADELADARKHEDRVKASP